MPHDWRPSARSHTSGQSSRNFRRIPHRKTTANTSASNYDKSQPTLTANDQKTTFSDDRQQKQHFVADNDIELAPSPSTGRVVNHLQRVSEHELRFVRGKPVWREVRWGKVLRRSHHGDCN